MHDMTYRYQTGDILHLRHSSPLTPAGDYVLLAVDDIVCLGRLVHSARGYRISKKRIYMLITDLCIFADTGRRYREWKSLSTASEVVCADQYRLVELVQP